MKVKELKVDKFDEIFQRVRELLSPECPVVISEHENTTGYPWCYVFVSSEVAEVIVSQSNWHLAYFDGLMCLVISQGKEDVIRELQEVLGEEIELEAMTYDRNE